MSNSDIKISCPHCGGHILFSDEYQNKVIACPHCSVPIALTSSGIQDIKSSSTLNQRQLSQPISTPVADTRTQAADFEKVPLFYGNRKWEPVGSTMIYALTFIIPPVGLIIGFLGIKCQPKRKQGTFLLCISLLLCAVYSFAILNVLNVKVGSITGNRTAKSNSPDGSSQLIQSELPVVDASEIVRVWNEMIVIDNSCKNDIQSGVDGMAAGRLYMQRLQQLKSSAAKVDPKLVALIGRKINVIGGLFGLYDVAARIERSDPNNQNVSTIPDRLNAQKSLGDIATESNSVDDAQLMLRTELQDKYHIELNRY